MVRSHARLYLTLAISLLLLMSYQAVRGPLNPFVAVGPMLGAVNGGILRGSDAMGRMGTALNSDPARLRELEEENLRLTVRLQQLASLEDENLRLQELLDLRSSLPNFSTPARVVSWGASQWSRTAILDKGLSHGITKDMAVVTTKGLWGKVMSVDSASSTVLLVDDERFSVAVRFLEDRSQGIVSGIGNGGCRLKYVGSETSIVPGQILITSGMDTLFPPDIPVGVIKNVSESERGFFQTVDVEPFAKPSLAEMVLVVGK